MKTFLKHAYAIAMWLVITLVVAIVFSGTLSGCKTVKKTTATQLQVDSTVQKTNHQAAGSRLDSTTSLVVIDSTQNASLFDYEIETTIDEYFDSSAWIYGQPVKRTTTTKERGTLQQLDQKGQSTTLETALHKSDTATRASTENAALTKKAKAKEKTITGMPALLKKALAVLALITVVLVIIRLQYPSAWGTILGLFKRKKRQP